jgi:molybdenum cofactor cytidylyltransferase
MTAGVAALVLAAGRSSRMGGANKLVVPVLGVEMIRRTVAEVSLSKASAVVVVAGIDATVHRLLTGMSVTVAVNEEPHLGISSSIRTGMRALPAGVDGVLVCLGDMPFVRARDVDRLLDVFESTGQADIVAPVHRGQRGNPVLFPRRLFEALSALQGDRGARQLVEEESERLRLVSIDDEGVLFDIDTTEDLRRANQPSRHICVHARESASTGRR